MCRWHRFLLFFKNNAMRWPLLFLLFSFVACGNGPEDPSVRVGKEPVVSQPPMPPAAEIALAKDSSSISSALPPIKRPAGIYRFLLPYGDAGILHTVAFYPSTFRLQEEYLYRPDSLVITEGTWAPSQGGIWLYKENLVRGRYFWKGDTLQYFSPRLKKRFSLEKLTLAAQNPVWQKKRAGGAVLYGIGTEPFWSVEVAKNDSVVFRLSDGKEPLRTKLTATAVENKIIVYTAGTDSLQVSVFPYFCNDGMSDLAYTKKIVVRYKGQVYEGCGMRW